MSNIDYGILYNILLLLLLISIQVSLGHVYEQCDNFVITYLKAQRALIVHFVSNTCSTKIVLCILKLLI